MKKTLLLPLIFFTGCMMGPNFTPPEVALNETWREPSQINEAWWEVFDDSILISLIEKTKECNYSLQAMEAAILRARSLKQIASSNLFPHLSTDWNATKTYFSKNGPAFAIGPAAGNAEGSSALPYSIQVPQIQNLFNGLFDASWELDLFGKTRRAVEVTEALIERAIDDKNALLITLYAEVARTYTELRFYQNKQDLLFKKIALLEEQKELIQAQFERGYQALLSLENTKALLENTKASLPDVTAEIYKSIYSLSTLTGQMPEALVESLQAFGPIPKAPPKISLGLKSDLLRRRPDIRRAEEDLHAATASIGVAVASFFPTFNLLGLIGLQSLKWPEFLKWGSRTFAYGADATMPLYQGGRLMGQLKLTQAEQKVTAMQYQQTVLNALEDVQSTFVAFEESQKSLAYQALSTESTKYTLDLTSAQFERGLVGKLPVLSAEENWTEARLLEIDRDKNVTIQAISLFKSLGGGWEDTCLEEEGQLD